MGFPVCPDDFLEFFTVNCFKDSPKEICLKNKDFKVAFMNLLEAL